ncbi:transcriptional regulator [Pseudomonas syringae]|uniref:transcriptional regulator n=1 Tax=Pseudomonas syringae TaxID=317 RepID=UPI000317F784|nr:transcriptional regulator [Pseudomonas syringae]
MVTSEAQSNRSIAILMNLAAGLDESGLECQDDRLALTSNVRHAAAAGAAALNQRAKRSTPFTNQVNGVAPRVPLVKSAANWLDQLKKAKGFIGDVTAAEFLGVSATQVSRWRTGKELLDSATAWAMAIALDINPMLIIGSIGFHDASGADRTRWLNLLSTIINSDLPSLDDIAQGPMSEDPPAQVMGAEPTTVHSEAPTPAPAPLSAQGSKWSDEEDLRLVAGFEAGEEIGKLATAHGRSAKSIILRLHRTHNLLAPELLTSLCQLYGFDLNVPATQQRNRRQREKKPVSKSTGDVFL